MHVSKRLTSLLVLGAALTAAACDRSPTSPALAPTGPVLATSVSTVCTSSTVPTGYVILGYTNYYTCGVSSYPTAMTIGIPGSSETVCESSPIPSAYVIASHTRTYNCDEYSPSSSSYQNANNIKIPTATYEYVCDDSPIPSNYTTTSYTYYTSSCDRYGNNTSFWPNAERIQKI